MNRNEERERNVQGTMSRGPRGEAAYGDDRGYGSNTDYRNEYEGGQGQQDEGQQYGSGQGYAHQRYGQGGREEGATDKNPVDKSPKRRPKDN